MGTDMTDLLDAPTRAKFVDPHVTADGSERASVAFDGLKTCRLYTSDAADE